MVLFTFSRYLSADSMTCRLIQDSTFLILKIFNLSEGELSIDDPLGKIFFISDGLMVMLNDRDKVKFARYISGLVGEMSDGDVVPDFFVENELRHWINKKFLLNCIDYLIDDNGLIEIRAKEKTLRLLDSEKTRLEHTYWQWFNIVAPLLSIMIFGLFNHIYRKRKYQIR